MGKLIELGFVLAAILAGCGSPHLSGSRLADNSRSAFKTYSIRGIPSRSVGCSSEAQEVAARFKEATGIEPYGTECVVGQEGDEVTVTYVSAERLPAVSAVFGLFGGDGTNSHFPFPSLDLPLWGTYSSLGACVTALPGRSADFSSETSLTPVASACYKAMHSGYVLRIDSFGAQPNKRFYNLPVEFKGKVDQIFSDQVADLFERQGGSVRAAVPWGGYVVTMFYAATPIGLDVRTVGLFGQVESPATCRAELAESLRALRLVMGQEPDLSSCLPNSYDSTAHINFAFTTQTRLPAFWRETGPVYNTYEGCAADRSHLVETFRQSTGRNVTGSVCVMKSSVLPSKYEAVLIGG